MASKGIEKDRRSIYLACDGMNFAWKRKEIDNFELMWSEGKSIRQIGDVLNRDPDEVLILALDRIKNRKIEERPGGALGAMA
ncbi:hypothetical protein JOD82_005446 [Paenibacillus sp. 1182]|uniref:hypothetical protein n=1 Tax=Paenibacillus sp. 1182 TaxID=2806565 RepID=UPI001AE5A4AA|nr:hypothetical protein [Paenibacillus sp. 1182]MBP1312301.1 hypothetical protein [Paenibacillus sp. 1182]